MEESVKIKCHLYEASKCHLIFPYGNPVKYSFRMLTKCISLNILDCWEVHIILIVRQIQLN